MKLTRFEKIILKITIGLEIAWDIVRDFFRTEIAKTIANVAILFCSLYIIFSYKPIAQSLPSCDTLPSNVTPNAGVNCLYFGLPLCRDVVNPNHRVNCADLVDLPLCSDIVISGGVTAKPGKNCVDLCSLPAYDNPDPAASPPLVRSVDYAIFNKDCIRFCDQLESGITANPGVNCINRKCHQVVSGVTPTDGTNCNIMNCNLLTPDELNKTKFNDSSKKYCNGNIKCYNFTQAQLPYMKLRTTNPTCLIHNCAPSSPNCGASDVLNITNQDSTYTSVYETYINAGFDISSNAICTPTSCRPLIRVQYRCTTNGTQITGDNSLDTVRNNSCDSTGDGATCNANYCYLSIDCNLAANQNRSECLVAANVPPINGEDPFDSWFYRPKPMDKATNGAGIIRDNMRGDFCYEQGAMEDNDWGRSISIGLIDLGWFTDYLGFDTRSPGACGASHSGNRGTGYGYLCNVEGNLFKKPSDYTAYFKGYAATDFNGTNPKHKVTVCLRFTNTMTTNACGARECGITAAFSEFWGQTCGGDVCRELEIDDTSDAVNCNITSGANINAACADTIDDYMRVRAVKYYDKVCAFLDSKGQVSYNKMFLDGSETLNDGTTCINDPDGSGTTGCHGHDSNSTQAEASGWRALMKVHYVDNNQPGTPRGYLDRTGKLYPEQECPKITLRIPPPNLYQLANVGNSQKLFSPPLYIRSVSIMRDREDAVIPAGAQFGKTDFHYPEVKIQFGATIQPMSLGLGYTGYEPSGSGENYVTSPSSKVISTTINNTTYNAELFVRKEYSENGSVPIFCVYRKANDSNGVALDPLRIACVEREKPYISNSFERDLNPNLPARRVFVTPKPGNQFNNAKLLVRYLASYGSNNSNNNCSGDDVCSTQLELGNSTFGSQECSLNLETHKLCAQREECSQLNIECVQNEVDLRNAEINNQSTATFLSKRESCNKDILPLCNRKKGITTASNASIYNMNPDNSPADPNAYGWFNDLCVVKGFESRLKNIISYKISSGIKGKCLIDPNSPYLTDGNSSTNCDAGGFAPNCLCIEAPQDYVTNSNEIVRKQTPREAGLCIDMPQPQMCLEVNHNPSPNSDINDLDYVYQSLGKNSYNNATGVNLSHQYRTQGKPNPNGILTAGHAEFPTILIGISDVFGECRGYWTYQKNGEGIIQKPTMSCLNSNGNAVWESTTRNACVRYACDDILTSGPDATGIYQGAYGKDETAENKGATNGFATWSKYTKTNDFMENSTAIACIYGFKPIGSNAVYDNGAITGYSGGTLPTRQCNQLGQWQTPTNSCQRITCPAINPTIPTSSTDTNAWNAWYNSGGATFSSVNASRSNIRTQVESIASGTCNNNLGFFQSPGGQPPTRNCDYLGNWGPVNNPCVTTCSAITSDVEASNLNNGFSRWAAVTGNLSNQGVEGTFAGCAAGYITNPYPPATDINGNPLDSATANDLTRPAENPRRLCKPGQTQSGVSASVWANVNNGCINKCPGYDVDTREGVGATTHQTSIGSVTLQWPSTNLGADAYITNWNGVESQFSAQYFIQGRTNNYYLVKRHCNMDGKWSDPQPMCMANSGQIANATYQKSATAAGYVNSVVAGDSSAGQTLTGQCIANYWKYNNDTGALPQRNCVFASGNNYIDKVYLELKSGTNDCEQKKCPPIAAYKGTRTKFTAVSGYSPIGTQLLGTCLMNETNSANATMYTTQSGVAPTRNCQTDGTWSAVLNETNCKMGCDFNGTYGWRKNNGGCGDGMWYSWNGFNMKHGQSIYFMITDDCGECDASTFAYYCNDGVSYTNRYEANNWSGCHLATYIPETNSFNGTTNMGTFTNFSFPPSGNTFITKTNTPGNIAGWMDD